LTFCFSVCRTPKSVLLLCSGWVATSTIHLFILSTMPNHPIDPSRNSQTDPQRTQHPSSLTTQHRWGSSEPFDDHPASFAIPQQTHVPMYSHNPQNLRYPSAPRSGQDLSPHGGTQSVLYRESSQRTPMDDPPHPSAYPPYQQAHELPVRGPVKRREPDQGIRLDYPTPRHAATSPNQPGFISNTHGGRPSGYPQQTHISTAPSIPHLYHTASSSGRQPAQDLSPGANDMNNMLSEFTLGSPTPSSSSSSVSPASPYFDRRALQPSVYTMRMQENSLETLDDPNNRAALDSLIKSSGGIHSVSNEKNMDTLPFATHSIPPIGAQHAHWSQSPMDNLPSDRVYNNPSRSTSSQSSASHSTSDSDSAQGNPSSLPIGVTRRSHNPASNTSAGGVPRKNKMHQCRICDKWFPRPSGLATHMNSHSGAKRSLIAIDMVY
jgi:hypothetical protein